MSLWECRPVDPKQARLLNPLQLAYLGDAVWDLMVRSTMLARGLSVGHMHKTAVKHVSAAAQAEALRRLEGILTEEESDVVRRGRNSHAHHPSPRNQDPGDYAAATGLEALVGFLFMTGQDDRLQALYDITQDQEANPCRRLD